MCSRCHGMFFKTVLNRLTLDPGVTNTYGVVYRCLPCEDVSCRFPLKCFNFLQLWELGTISTQVNKSSFLKMCHPMHHVSTIICKHIVFRDPRYVDFCVINIFVIITPSHCWILLFHLEFSDCLNWSVQWVGFALLRLVRLLFVILLSEMLLKSLWKVAPVVSIVILLYIFDKTRTMFS